MIRLMTGRFIRITLMLGSFAVLAVQHTQAGEDPSKALDLLKQGKTKEAVELLEQALKKEKDRRKIFALHGMLGDAYLSQMKIEKAIRHYDALLTLDPFVAQAHLRKGEALMQRMRTADEALASFEKAEALGMKTGRLYANMAFCDKMRGDFEKDPRKKIEFYRPAAKYYRKALALDPKNIRAMGNLGDILFNIGHLDGAIEMYGKMLEVRPDDILALARLGHSQLIAGKGNEALITLRKGIAITAARTDEGDLRQRVMLHDIRLELHAYLAKAHEAMGHRKEALAAWQRVLKLAEAPHPAGKGMTSIGTENIRKLTRVRIKALSRDAKSAEARGGSVFSTER